MVELLVLVEAAHSLKMLAEVLVVDMLDFEIAMLIGLVHDCLINLD